jgi:hypothetical protein
MKLSIENHGLFIVCSFDYLVRFGNEKRTSENKDRTDRGFLRNSLVKGVPYLKRLSGAVRA